MYVGNIEDNSGFTKEAGIKLELQDLEAVVPGSAANNDDKITGKAVLDHCKASQIARTTHNLFVTENFIENVWLTCFGANRLSS